MRTLIAIPYHSQKEYCLTELFEWINKAELPDSEILLRVHKGIYGEKDAVKNQREFFRLEAQRLNVDYLMFVGADTLPPLDVLPKLLAHNVDVVGGIYYGRPKSENGVGNTAVAWRHKDVNANKKEFLQTQTGLLEVDGMGMDCVLLSKKAFDSISFKDWIQNDDDYPYYDKLKEKGFKIFLDTSIVCKHYYQKDKFN